MANTSATGGYLSPDVVSPPLEGDDLDDEFQEAVVGITGLAGSLVRPRWQPGNPKQPEPTVDWCAIGITTQTPDATPHIQHSGAGNGKDTLKRHELINVLCTFYGPNSKRNAASTSSSGSTNTIAVPYLAPWKSVGSQPCNGAMPPRNNSASSSRP